MVTTTATETPTRVAAAETPRITRREEVAFVVFSAWTIIGLFLDGWAHVAGRPESFFTPWHGVLYSGVAAGMTWGVLERRRSGVTGPATSGDRLAAVGGALFLGAGVADFVWHELFGIEEDVEALLSPTHLLLMVAGLLLVTAPLRGEWQQRLAAADARPRLRDVLPQVAACAFTAAVILFFLMFLSPFAPQAQVLDEDGQVYAAISVLVTNVVLLAPLSWLAARTRLPRGAVTLHVAVITTLVAGLHGFARLPLVAAAVTAAAVVDLLLDRFATRTSGPGEARLAAVATPLLVWTAYFVAYEAAYALSRPVELWSGPIVLAVLAGSGLQLLAGSRRSEPGLARA